MVCVVGFTLSLLLTHLHFYPELRTPLCSQTRPSCDAVLASPYAVFHGVPLSALGLVYYLAVAVLLLLQVAGGRQRALGPLVALGLLASALFVALQAFVIHAFCTLCCGSALCCLVLAALVGLGGREGSGQPARARRWGALALLTVILLRLSFPLFERPRTLTHADYRLGHRYPPRSEAAPQDALNVLVFFDFECPYCREIYPLFRKALRDHPGKIVLYFRDFPLAYHAQAWPAAKAAEAAEEQGKFWEYADLLEEPGCSLDDATLLACARKLGLDIPRFERDRHGAGVDLRLKGEQQDAARLGITGVPAVFLNQTQVAADATVLATIEKRL